MEKQQFKPFIDSHENVAELSWGPVLVGVVLGIVFGASSLYLALKVGMTVSASIPIAVLSITIFRGFSKVFGFRKSTILENNIVQTTGSAGESIAFGVAVTMPALLILGYNLDFLRSTMVAVLGALLGVLMMIPLRRSLIVKGHGQLLYPEGTACASVLEVGEKGGTSAQTVFTGFFVGLFYKILNIGCKLWPEEPMRLIPGYKGAYFSTQVAPELLGVGYIIGFRTSLMMFGGGILSTFVLIPAIKLFGDGLTTPLYPATTLISQMSVHEVWKNYVLYIGAGAVTAGGIISLLQNMPLIARSFLAGVSGLQNSGKKVAQAITRTDRDIAPKWVALGVGFLVVAIWLTPVLHVNILGAILIVLFGFLFVTVSSRITGEIGSSSNPISGMTVATLLLTCLIFVLMGWVGAEYRVTALSIAAVVCVAASNGGTTSQDLKTGYLVGATPRNQQIALLIGALSSALVIGYTLIVLNDAGTVYSKKDYAATFDINGLRKEGLVGPDSKNDEHEYYVLHLSEPQGEVPAGKYLLNDNGKVVYLADPGINGVLKTRDDGTPVQKYEAPKARLMSLIIDGILTQKLPWGLVLLGVFLSIVIEMCGASALTFAVGVYLPISASAPVFFGGLIRGLVEWRAKVKAEDSETSPAVLLSTGLIAGASIAGISIALISVNDTWARALDFSGRFPSLAQSDFMAYGMFAVVMALVFAAGKGFIFKDSSESHPTQK